MSLRGLGESKRQMIKDGNPVKVMGMSVHNVYYVLHVSVATCDCIKYV